MKVSIVSIIYYHLHPFVANALSTHYKYATNNVVLNSNQCRQTQKQLSFDEKNKIVRRTFLSTLIPIPLIVLTSFDQQSAVAAETVGKDPNCNDGSCLGVWDGLLADCPHDSGSGVTNLLKTRGAGCASSQDDTPGIFSEPWDYSESSSLDWEKQVKLLIPTIELVCSKRGDQVKILMLNERYLRVLFIDGKTSAQSVGEFYFTPNDTTVQFRVASLDSYAPSSLKNIERCELIRKELRYLKVPVLRNRKRSLFFVESDFDTFGPGSAALGPPAEMKTGEIEGRQDVDLKLKLDAVQLFPLRGD